MTSTIDHIDAALDMTAGIVGHIRADQLTLASLCPGWTVGVELNHLVGGMRIFAAEISSTHATKDHHDDWLEGDHHTAFTTAAALDRAAWHRADALISTIQLGFGPVPAPMAAHIHWTEILVHGTDLAVATGQTGLIDEQQCDQLLATMHAMDFDVFRQPGMFGGAQPARDDATAYQRLLAFLGRELPLHTVQS